MRRLVIIDDFYASPDDVRSIALSAAYVAKGIGTYPGQNSVEPFLPPGLTDMVGSHIGRPVKPTPHSAHGLFRIHFLNDAFEQFIHVDPPADWAGVLYLNPNEQCKGGTAFWRHKETNLVHYPSRAKAIELGIEPRQVHDKFNLRDGLKAELWDMEFLCPARYNRLVLFPSKCWHSHMPVEGFGATRDDSRLVQLFFFNNKE